MRIAPVEERRSGRIKLDGAVVVVDASAGEGTGTHAPVVKRDGAFRHQADRFVVVADRFLDVAERNTHLHAPDMPARLSSGDRVVEVLIAWS